MKKVMLIAIAAVAALSFAPGHAAEVPGCATVPNFTGSAEGADQVCTYTASGPGRYVAATPNGWSIVVVRNGVAVETKGAGSLNLPTRGDLSTQAGDVVTVTQENDCAVAPVCGQGGTVSAAG